MTEKISQFNISPIQELKTDLKPIEKAYLDRLVASVNQVLKGRTIEQMVAGKDVAGLEKYLQLVKKLKALLEDKKIDELEEIKPEILFLTDSKISDYADHNITEVKDLIKEITGLEDGDLLLYKIVYREDGKLVYVDFTCRQPHINPNGSHSAVSYNFLLGGDHLHIGFAMYSGLTKVYHNPATMEVEYAEELAVFEQNGWHEVVKN